MPAVVTHPDKPKQRKPKPPRGTGVQLGETVARNMILLGAARVFAVHGFRAASVEDLLEASTVSRRTFYRFFKSKDDVGLALYNVGTSGLLEMCRRAMEQESDLLGKFEACIHIHLRNAREKGRLIFVLGGEAHRLESPLHARRMEVHEALVAMIQEHPAAARLDPWLFRTLIFALEAVTRTVLQEGDDGRRVTEASIERARRVMVRVATASLAGGGVRVAPLPTIE